MTACTDCSIVYKRRLPIWEKRVPFLYILHPNASFPPKHAAEQTVLLDVGRKGQSGGLGGKMENILNPHLYLAVYEVAWA